MASIEQVLDQLDPPLKHRCETQDGKLQLTLIDPDAHAQVHRSLSASELADPVGFRITLLYAVNEIRGKGSHAPLSVLPIADKIEIL